MAMALACWSTSGCLAADEPTFPEPVKTPPFLLAQTALPALSTPKVAFPTINDTSLELSVEVRSEDGGDPLVAKLVYNYPTATTDLGPISDKFPPGKLGDTGRILSLTLPKDKLPFDTRKTPPAQWTGCLQVSMLVTHQSNTEPTNGITFLDLSQDIGVVTWWLNIQDLIGAPPATLDGCTK